MPARATPRGSCVASMASDSFITSSVS
jgi:hypothetical protein